MNADQLKLKAKNISERIDAYASDRMKLFDGFLDADKPALVNFIRIQIGTAYLQGRIDIIAELRDNNQATHVANRSPKSPAT